MSNFKSLLLSVIVPCSLLGCSTLSSLGDDHPVVKEPGPKFPKHLGSGGVASAVAPSMLEVDYADCKSTCDGTCVPTNADKLLLIAGSSVGHGKTNEQIINRAMARRIETCGDSSVMLLHQPSKRQLEDEIRRTKSSLLGVTYLGHGFSSGLLLEDPADGSALSQESQTNLLTPSELGSQLKGTPIPYVDLLSCDQGNGQEQNWQSATLAKNLLFFDGAASIDDVATLYMDLSMSKIPCGEEKLSCIL